jgi:signal transduction histidine kinase
LARSIGARLSLRIALALGAATVVVLAAFLVVADRALIEGADRILLDELEEAGPEIVAAARTPADLGAAIAKETESDAAYFFVQYRISRPGGPVLASNFSPTMRAHPLVAADAPADSAAHTHWFGFFRRFRMARRRIDSAAFGTVDVEGAMRIRNEDQAMRRLINSAVIAAPLLALGIGWLAVLLARSALGPVAEIDRAARRIGTGPASSRLPRTGTGDELDALAETLNTMLDRIQAAHARNLEFTGAVAHELRTPLATVRTRLEAAALPAGPARANVEQALEELGRTEALIRNLLLLSRTDEGGAGVERRRVEVGEVVSEVAAFFAPLAEAAGFTIAVEPAPGPLPVEGDRGLLTRALSNLVDNAVRYSEGGGEIRLVAARCPEGVEMRVEDAGRGVPEAARGRLFERFAPRGTAARERNAEGSGLGLAIVRAIALAHGGEARYAPRPGGGSIFRIVLPAASAEGSRRGGPPPQKLA